MTGPPDDPPGQPVDRPAATGTAVHPATAVPARRENRVAAGIVWMLLAGTMFVTMSAIMKHLGQTIPTAQIVFFRMAAGFAMILPVAWVSARSVIMYTPHPGRQAIRSFFGAASLGCSVYALAHLPFATATALAFTTPLWIIVLAALFLREMPTPLVLVAAAIGFAGVIIIAEPTVVIEPAVLVGIAAAIFGGAALTMVRSLSARDSSLTLVFWFSLYGTLYSLPPALFDWVPLDPLELAMACATGLLGAIGLFCSAQAYRLAAAAFVAPADFIRLPLAGLIGLILFGELPGVATILGTLLILTALVILILDGRRRRPPAPTVD